MEFHQYSQTLYFTSDRANQDIQGIHQNYYWPSKKTSNVFCQFKVSSLCRQNHKICVHKLVSPLRYIISLQDHQVVKQDKVSQSVNVEYFESFCTIHHMLLWSPRGQTKTNKTRV